MKLEHIKEFLLFNCCEGLQSDIIVKKLKMNNLDKIILTDLNINNISGLLGLLSSLNSIGRMKAIHLYGPEGLAQYLDLGKKYSHTNFKYILYVHVLKSGLIIDHKKYRMYTFMEKNRFNFFMIESEQSGKFMIRQAEENYLLPSPLYSYLKKGYTFILPDGLSIEGLQFTKLNYEGYRFIFIVNKFYYKKFIRNSMQSMILLHKTC